MRITQMNKKWFEVFKIGKHVDSSGREHSYTNADLDNIAKKYNEQRAEKKHDAPITIGHPKDNKPAYGWVKELKRVGSNLFAYLDGVIPEFEEMFTKGMFKKKSISLYPDGLLRHIAFLGAVPPAVKGLSDVPFSESDNLTTFDFDEVPISLNGKELVMNQEMIELQKSLEDAKREAESLKEYKENSEKLEVRLKEANDKINQKESELIEHSKKIKELEISSYLEAKIDEGILVPAQRDRAIRILEKLDAEESKLMKEFIESLPIQIRLGEESKGNNREEGIEFRLPNNYGELDSVSMDLHKRVAELSKKERISYQEALLKLSNN